MIAARTPRDRDDVRLLVVATDGSLHDHAVDDLPRFLRKGDLLVVNDAATIPGSLAGQVGGQPVELRLAAIQLDGTWQAVLFGAGDWRTRTEDRPAPPRVAAGARIDLGRLQAEVLAVSDVSPRLLHVRFEGGEDDVWTAIYDHGRPVQYAHVEAPLDLWSVQTVFAARPWAVELPSAGRPLSWRTLRLLETAGVDIATVTHAAGLSSTGDPALDRALPLPERYEVPASTVWRIAEAKRRGRRVIAVGTTVVRALESSAAAGGGTLPRVRHGMATLRIDASTKLRVVDGLLTGMHMPGESHFDLLGAFVPADTLDKVSSHAERSGYLCHEFGDLTLVGGQLDETVGLAAPPRACRAENPEAKRKRARRCPELDAG